MAKQAESELSGKIVGALNARGHCVWKNHGSIYSVAGLSDITGFASDGVGILLETKMPGKQITGLTPEQHAFIRRAVAKCPIVRAGVPTTVREAIEIVEDREAYTILRPGEVLSIRPAAMTDAEVEALRLALGRWRR